MTKLYTGPALADRAGITYRQATHWTTLGALRPVAIEGSETGGSGNRRVYDDHEVEVARIVRVLTGLDVIEAAKVARALANGRAAHLPFGIEVRYAPTTEAPR